MDCYYRDEFWQARIAKKVLAATPPKPRRKGPSATNSVTKDTWDMSTSKSNALDTDW